MFCKLSKSVRVYITGVQLEFLYKYENKFPVRQTAIDPEDIHIAQTLAAKTILVRKKLDNDTLYNLNRAIRFEKNDNKTQTRTGKTD